MISKTYFTSIVNLTQPPFIGGNKTSYAQLRLVVFILLVLYTSVKLGLATTCTLV